ncbi:MAG TPA: hypothetical protein VFT70_11255 [Nocardioides sp.]|nr:hypothetical protein [Nocardioides sp.]
MRNAIGAVVLGLALLSGCGSDDEPESTPAPAGTPTAPAATTSAATSPADVPHPCDTATKADVAGLVGGRVTVTRVPETGTGPQMTCTFVPADLDRPTVTLQTTVDGGTLDDYVALMTATGATASDVDVPGAARAALLVDDRAGRPGATAVTEVDGTIRAALVIGADGQGLDRVATQALALMLD